MLDGLTRISPLSLHAWTEGLGRSYDHGLVCEDLKFTLLRVDCVMVVGRFQDVAAKADSAGAQGRGQGGV